MFVKNLRKIATLYIYMQDQKPIIENLQMI